MAKVVPCAFTALYHPASARTSMCAQKLHNIRAKDSAPSSSTIPFLGGELRGAGVGGWTVHESKPPEITVETQFIMEFMWVSWQECEVYMYKKNIHLASASLHEGPWRGSHK